MSLAEPNPLLDLAPGVGAVYGGPRFTVLVHGEPGGDLRPAVGGTLTLDTQARILRQVQGFDLLASDAAAINPLSDEIAIRWELEDGTAWPLGILRFADQVDPITTITRPSRGVLHDRSALLDLPLFTTTGLSTGERVDAKIRDLLLGAGLSDFTVDEGGFVLTSDPLFWDVGTPRKQVLDELARLAGMLPPYFDATGRCIVREAPPLSPADLTQGNPFRYHIYPLSDSRIVVGTGEQQSNLLTAPNGHQVVGAGVTGANVAAVAWVDPQAPHSRQNTYPRVLTHRVQGVDSEEAALRVARTHATTDPLDYRTVRFAGPPDPRHDAYDLVEFGGIVYREVRWSLPLRAGQPMTHELNRAGQP